YYKTALEGKPARCIALHLIVTPEYIKRVHGTHPDLRIYALRLDRGLSPAAVLRTEPGTRWDEERGLNDIHYIVPGAGGVGEILNTAWVCPGGAPPADAGCELRRAHDSPPAASADRPAD